MTLSSCFRVITPNLLDFYYCPGKYFGLKKKQTNKKRRRGGFLMLLHQTLGGALCSVECRQIPRVGTHLWVSCACPPPDHERGRHGWFAWVLGGLEPLVSLTLPPCFHPLSQCPIHQFSHSSPPLPVPSTNRVWPSQQIEGLGFPLSLALPSPLRRRGSDYYLCWLSPSLTASTRLFPFLDAPYLFLIACATQIELCYSSSEEVPYALD